MEASQPRFLAWRRRRIDVLVTPGLRAHGDAWARPLALICPAKGFRARVYLNPDAWSIRNSDPVVGARPPNRWPAPRDQPA